VALTATVTLNFIYFLVGDRLKKMQASQPTFLTQGLDRSPSPPLAQHSGSREATYDSPKAPNGGK